LSLGLLNREPAHVNLLRGKTPFVALPSGEVQNHLRLHIENLTAEAREYQVELRDVEGARLIVARTPLSVESRAIETTALVVVVPPGAIPGGQRAVTFLVSDGHELTRELPFVLLGPGSGGR
jgi:hypothetical protein